MCVLTARQQRHLDAQMGADPTLAEGLAPLLERRFGSHAREMMLRCLARRFAGGWPVGMVPLLALADALRLAHTQATEPPRGSDRDA